MPASSGLARRTGVELIRTGSWQASTGTWTPTREDILAAVEALKCPAVRRPRLKLGHTDERFNGDGQPALGWFENLRAEDGGHTLVADQVALSWLNTVQAAAYPDRSIEGNYRHRCSLGHDHPFVITAVALLGVTPPAVSTLKSVTDLPEMLGVAASEEVPEGAEHVEVTIHAADENQLKNYWTKSAEGLAKWRDHDHPWRALYAHLRKFLGDERAKRVTSDWYREVFGHMPNEKVKASDGEPVLSRAERIRAAWNASSPPLSQWVQEARPDAAIVVDDADRTYRLYPVTFDGDDVVFGEPQPYDPEVDRPLVFASRAESRPEPEVTAGDPDPAPDTVPPADPTPVLPAAEPEQVINPDPKEADPVSTTDLSAFRSRLGLADDADEQAILSAVDELKAKADTPQPTPEMVAASAADQAEKDELRKEVQVLASQLQQVTTEVAAAKAEKAASVKASVLDEAQRLGKFAPAEREDWERDYDEAPAAVTRVLASIAAGTKVPVPTSVAGNIGDAEPSVSFDDDALTEAFFGPGTAAKFKTQEA